MSSPILDRFVRILGDLKVFPWPLFLLYDPSGYRVKGRDARAATEVVRPGDLLVRGFVNYLDGYLIPGYFSHVGIYLGEVTEADRGIGRPEAGDRFRTGPQMVVHALAEGVLLEDLLDFCRCDFLAVLRFPERLQARHPPLAPLPPLDPDEERLHRDLVEGVPVRFADAFPVIRRLALSEVGIPYDMGFDFTDFTRFSCTELVYFATKALHPFLGVAPERRRVLLFSKRLIEPDAYVRSGLEVAWHSPSTRPSRLERLRLARPPPAPPPPADPVPKRTSSV